MVAGNIGSDTIMSYTVIGDAVNLGARLESLNKDYGTRIIISEATRAQLKGRYDIHPLGDVIVKGKTPTGRDFRGQTNMKRTLIALAHCCVRAARVSPSPRRCSSSAASARACRSPRRPTTSATCR